MSSNQWSLRDHIPGTSSHFLEPTESGGRGQGRLRYLTGGTGAPLVMLHTVRTQAEHFRHLIPLVQERYTVYALDLPGMGYSQIVSGASYQEPAMRAAVKSLIVRLDLREVTLLGESMGAVLALTTAADLPERVRRVLAINPYDYAGGIARSSLLARFIITGVLAPVVGPVLAGLEPKPIMRAVLSGGLVDKTALREDYLDELLRVGRRPGYPTVARSVYASLPSLIAARSHYPAVQRSSPPHLWREGLVANVRPTGQQPAALHSPIHRSAKRRPLHRLGKTRRASRSAEPDPGIALEGFVIALDNEAVRRAPAM